MEIISPICSRPSQQSCTHQPASTRTSGLGFTSIKKAYATFRTLVSSLLYALLPKSIFSRHCQKTEAQAAQIQQLQQQLREKNTCIARLRRQLSADHSRLAKNCFIHREKARQQQTKIQALTTNVEELKKQLSQSHAELAGLNTRLAPLQRQHSTDTRMLQTLQTKVDSLTTELKEVTTALQNREADIIRLADVSAAEINKHIADFNELQNTYNDLVVRFNELATQLEELYQDNAILTDALVEKQQQKTTDAHGIFDNSFMRPLSHSFEMSLDWDGMLNKDPKM